MSRSMTQWLPSQEASSKMSKHDLEAIEETETPNTNAFLVENVLRRLFKIIESVSKLKELRRMCQLWDRVDTEELEERAFQGLFKPTNLTFFNELSGYFKPIKTSRLEMREFLDDTSSNPRLFRSFSISVIFQRENKGSLAILNLHKFRSFYKDYSPTFLELTIFCDFKFNQDKERLLKELFRWAAPTLRQLDIRSILDESDLIPTRKTRLPVQSFNFPHLRKVNMLYGVNDIAEAFKVIFTNGQTSHSETPSLVSISFRYGFPDDLLDLMPNPTRWTNITMLEIQCNRNDHRLSQLTNGLLSLARAGMTLKKLSLGIDVVNWEGDYLRHFRDLFLFFASQASSLEALKFSLNFSLKEDVTIEEDQMEQIKLQLPVFERIHTLFLDLDTHNNDILTRNIIELGSISQHFPALKNLTILLYRDSIDAFSAFFGGSCEEEERMSLKRIAIPTGILGNGLDLGEIFGSVEAFSCLQSSFTKLGILGDLVDTIRVLHIRDVYSELDLSQFKGLRRVVIEEDDKIIRNRIWGLFAKRKLEENIERYLGYFKKVAELGLDSIKFRGLEIVGEEYKKIAEAFPFRVEFEEKPVDWDEEDFMNI